MADLLATLENTAEEFTVLEKSGSWTNGMGPTRTGYTDDGTQLDLSGINWNTYTTKKAPNHESQTDTSSCNFDNPTLGAHLT